MPSPSVSESSSRSFSIATTANFLSGLRAIASGRPPRLIVRTIAGGVLEMSTTAKTPAIVLKLQMEDEKFSGEHAQIYVKQDRYCMRDEPGI